MMKMTNLLRRTCAWVLAIGMTLMPVLPGTFAEEGSNPTATPVAETTVTPAPTPTEVPAVVPTETPMTSATPEGTEGTPSTEPSIVPSLEPSVEPSVDPSLEPSQEPSVEPSAEPTEDAAMALMGDVIPRGYTLTPVQSELVLFSGNTASWLVAYGNYTGTVKFTSSDSELKIVSASSTSKVYAQADVTAPTVTEPTTFTITASGTDCDPVPCTVTVLPKPTKIVYTNLTTPMGLTYEVAKTFNFKKDGGEWRFKLTFPMGVDSDDIDLDVYAKLVIFEATKVSIDSETGVLNPGAESQTFPIKDIKITMKIKDDSTAAYAALNTLSLTIYKEPKSIKFTEANDNHISLPVGKTHTLSYQVLDADGGAINLSNSVNLESSDETVVEVVPGTDNIVAVGTGDAAITATLEGYPLVAAAKCYVNVKNVPDADDIEIRTVDGVDPFDEEGTLYIGLNETLNLVPQLTESAQVADCQIDSIACRSESVSYVTATKTTVNGKTAIQLKGVKVSETSNDDPVPTDVIITINGDLKVPGGPSMAAIITIPVVVTANPTSLSLSRSTVDMCSGDEFVLKVKPDQAGTSARYTLAPNVAGYLEIQELPDRDDPQVAEYKVKALKEGTVTLTVTVATTSTKPASAKCTFNISKKPDSIDIDEPIVMSYGMKYQLQPYFLVDKVKKEGSFTYSVTSGAEYIDTSAASGYLAKGILYANNPAGVDKTVTVRIAAKNYTTTAVKAITVDVTITDAPTGIDFGSEAIILGVGETVTVRPKFLPTNTTANVDYWVSYNNPSDPTKKVEAVSIKTTEDGFSVVLKGLKAGTNTLHAATHSDVSPYPIKMASIKVTVGSAVTSIKASDQTMGVGQEMEPAYTLNSGALCNGVYYRIEEIAAGTLGYDTFIDPNTGVVTRTEIQPGKAKTDDQTNPDDLSLLGSTSGDFRGTKIIATQKGRIKVTVRPKHLPYTTAIKATFYIDIVEAPMEADFKFADTTQLNMLTNQVNKSRTIKLSAGFGGHIRYESSNTTVATVDANGYVTAKDAGGLGNDGFALIKAVYPRAEAADLTSSYWVYVSNAPTDILITENLPPAGETDTPSILIGVGETRTFFKDIEVKYPAGDIIPVATVPVTYANMAGTALTVSGASVKGNTVGKNYSVVLKLPNDVNKAAKIDVLKKPHSIGLNATKVTVGEEEKFVLEPIVYQSLNKVAGAETRTKVTWSLSDSSLATIKEQEDGTLLVTVKPGKYVPNKTTTFTVTAQSVCGTALKATCTFTIGQKPTKVLVRQLSPVKVEDIDEMKLAVGVTAKLQPYLEPVNAGGYIDNFSDSVGITGDPNDPDPTACVYMVENSDGTLTIKTLREGTAYIRPKTYKDNPGSEKTAEVVVKVLPAPAKEDVTFEPLRLAVGMTGTLTPIISTNTMADFRFISGNSAALTIAEKTGKITKVAKADGPVTVTVEWLDSNGNKVSKQAIVETVAAPTAIRFRKLQPDGTLLQDNLSSLSLNLSAGDEYTFEYYYLPNTGSYPAISELTLPTGNFGKTAFTLVEHVENPGKNGGRITLKAGAKVSSAVSFTVKTFNGKSATVSVAVKAVPDYIQVVPTTMEIGAGRSAKFTKITVNPASSGGDIYFTSDAPSGVEVNPLTGEVKVSKTNSVAITFQVWARSSSWDNSRANDEFNTCNVTILRAPTDEDIFDYLVRKGTTTPLYSEDDGGNVLCVGDKLTAYCAFPTRAKMADPDDYEIYSGTKVTYAVPAASKAYLSATASGEIKGLKKTPVGSVAYVYATADTGAVAMIPFEVKDAPTALKILVNEVKYPDFAKSGLQMSVGDVMELEDPSDLNLRLELASDNQDLEDLNITFSSSNTGVVKITLDKDKGYKLQALKAGTATITFSTYNAKKASFKVVVRAIPTAMKLSSGTDIVLGEGMRQLVTISYTPSNAYVEDTYFDFDSQYVDVERVSNTKFYITGIKPTAGEPNDKVPVEVWVYNSAQLMRKISATVNVKVLPGPDEIEIIGVAGGKTNLFGDDGEEMNTIGIVESRTITYTVTSGDGFSTSAMRSEIKAVGTAAMATPGAALKIGAAKQISSALNDTVRTYTVVVTGSRAGEVEFDIVASNGISSNTTETFTVKAAPSKVVFSTPSTSMTIAPDEEYEFTYGTDPDVGKQAYTVSYPAASNNYPFDIDHDADTGTITIKAWDNATLGKTVSIVVNTYNGKAATIKFTVRRAFNPAGDNITLSPSTTTNVTEGYPYQLKYALSNSAGAANVTFHVESGDGVGLDEDTGIICASPTGGTAIRDAKVYAEVDGKRSNVVPLKIKPGPQENPLTTTVDPTGTDTTPLVMGKGETLKMVYQQPTKYTYTTAFTYSSNNPDYVTYSGGTITAKSVGSGDVTLTAKNGRSYSRTVDVLAAPTGLQWTVAALTELDPDENNVITRKVGETIELAGLTETLPLGTSASFARTYATSNKAYAAVNTTGKLTAVKATPGTTLITITVKTYNGKACTLKVKVVPAP